MKEKTILLGESVESILVASNFFLWMANAGMSPGNSYLPLYLFIASIISLIVIILTKVEFTIIIQKLGLFMLVNFSGMLIILTNFDYGLEEETEEFDQFMFFFYLQLFMIAIVGIALLVRKFRLAKADTK